MTSRCTDDRFPRIFVRKKAREINPCATLHGVVFEIRLPGPRSSRDFAFRIEVPGHPAELASRLVAAEPLVHRTTSGPFAEFGRGRVLGYDLGRLIPSAKPPRKGARDATDRKAVDRSTDIALTGGAALQRQRVEIGEVLAMYQRPAHGFASHHRHFTAFGRRAGKAAKHTAVAGVDHGR